MAPLLQQAPRSRSLLVTEPMEGTPGNTPRGWSQSGMMVGSCLTKGLCLNGCAEPAPGQRAAGMPGHSPAPAPQSWGWSRQKALCSPSMQGWELGCAPCAGWAVLCWVRCRGESRCPVWPSGRWQAAVWT